MREVFSLNLGWKYNEAFCDEFVTLDFDDSSFSEVDLPHANKEIPYNYFDEKMYQFVSCYRRTINIPEEYGDKRVFVDFEGVMTYAEVYFNGERVGEHKGGYTPFSIELTGKVRFDCDNILVVKVDSTERDDIPPFGNVIDYLCYGGIYRGVNLRVVDRLYIENVFAKPSEVLEDTKSLTTVVFLNHAGQECTAARVEVKLKKDNKIVESKGLEFAPSAATTSEVAIDMSGLTGIELWDIEAPHLYDIEVLLLVDGQVTDSYQTRIGFREAVVRPDGFFLNNRRIKIRGLNRHQAYPYVGYAMPARVQKKDADILKNELHLNTVRTSHYPQSKYFLDRCDEIGLLVLEEIPGWQYIGDAGWKEVACENVREMIRRDWNHPSIFLWGVRINESQDDHDFYTRTNAIARELDDTRQTGGIRYLHHSEFLEDVYTINDFSHSGGQLVLMDPRQITGLDADVPYLVTEFNGHMYPTKRFDQEERIMEHAIRHARVQNAAGVDQRIAGAIGWCAFDYNTHKEFGSGDRICYHGVMDMFRIPKFAAHFYRSQVDPQQEVVLEPATLWARGERGVHEDNYLAIFTNCDYVEVYGEDEKRGTYYPAKETYPGLDYPPVVVDLLEVAGTWGMRWSDVKFVGYVDGKPKAERHFSANPVATKLTVEADDTELSVGEIDATRVVYKAVDQCGNLMPYLSDFVKFSVSGPGQIIGPSEVALIGGCVAVWVKTTGQSGEITLSASSSRLTAADVRIQVS